MPLLPALVLVLLLLGTALPRFSLALTVFPAALLVALVAEVPAEQLARFFPADFFVLIVGVTALFAVVQLNGTMDWLLGRALNLVAGRVALVPAVPFVAGAALTAIGTFPAAVVSVLAPVAMGLAGRHHVSHFLMSLVALNGVLVGLFSPLALFGVTTSAAAPQLGVDVPATLPVTLALAGLITGSVVGLVCLVLAHRTSGPEATRAGGAQEVRSLEKGSPTSRLVTLGTLAVVVGCSIGFELNLGYLALAAAVPLQLLFGIEPEALISKIPWTVVLLIGGLLTYVGLIQHLGTFDWLSDLVAVPSSPMLTLLVVCYLTGVTSFFANSVAVLVAALPLLPPLVEAGVSPVGALVAVALSSVLVDVNPVGVTGGLLLGAAEPEARPRLFRQLISYGAASVVVAPALAWAAFGWL